MNVSLWRSLVKGSRNALIIGFGAFVAALASPEVAAGFSDAGPVGSAVVLIVGALLNAVYDYLKRALKSE